MRSSRRSFLCGTVGAATGISLWPGAPKSAAGQEYAHVRIGACVVGLQQGKKAGLAGVEVPVGGPADQLEDQPFRRRRKYREQMKEAGIPISSLMMGLLNECPAWLPIRGPAWLAQSIDAAADLGAKVILVAFFGNGDLLDGNGRVKMADVDSVVGRLKAAAPRGPRRRRHPGNRELPECRTERPHPRPRGP